MMDVEKVQQMVILMASHLVAKMAPHWALMKAIQMDLLMVCHLVAQKDY